METQIKMPTDKQVEYATEISDLLGIPLPEEYTRRAFSDFIGKWQREYREAKELPDPEDRS